MTAYINTRNKNLKNCGKLVVQRFNKNNIIFKTDKIDNKSLLYTDLIEIK